MTYQREIINWRVIKSWWKEKMKNRKYYKYHIVNLRDMLFSIIWIWEEVMFIFELKNIAKISWLLWSIKLQNYCEEVAWRFAIVKLNKESKLSVPFPDKVYLWKLPLWDLRLLGKHCSETNVVCDKKQCFIRGHISYDHGHVEALQII